MRIGLYVSDSKNFSPNDDTRVDDPINILVKTSNHLLYAGASIVLGGDWSAEDVVPKLTHRLTASDSVRQPAFQRRNSPQILNRIAWGSTIPTGHRSPDPHIASSINFRVVKPFNSLLDKPTCSLNFNKYVRMRALTSMRKELVSISDARFCFGGELMMPTQWLPGAIEEALYTWNAGLPLYLSSALGGSSKALCQAILHRELSKDEEHCFRPTDEALGLHDEFKSFFSSPFEEIEDEPPIMRDVLSEVQTISVPELAHRARLKEFDYLTLMTTPFSGRAIELFWSGLNPLLLSP